MRLVRLHRCQSGIKLGKSIYNERGKVLLAKGTELTDSLIERLKKFNIFTVYIDDEASEGIEIVDSIPETLLMEAGDVITQGLDSIAELNSTSNLHGMIITGKTVQSFKDIFKNIIGFLTDNKTVLNLLATTKICENHVYTHSLNVSIYASQLAIANGLQQKKVEEIGLGALLHDLGKLFIPEEVLNKPGKLTREEFEQIKSHCELGFENLRRVHEIPLTVAHCALQHHERIDGAGYPRGLKGAEIHEYAKILSVADVFDAVTSHRVYRPGMLPHKGIEILYSGSGTQFERDQIQLFKNCIAIYPQGLTVKLNDGRTGIVSKYNFHSVGRPEIRVISNEEGQKVKPYEIDLSSKDYLTVEIVQADALL